MSVELTFCHFWENINHGVQSQGVVVAVVNEDLYAIVPEAPTNEFVYEQALGDNIDQVHHFKIEETHGIVLVLILVSLETLSQPELLRFMLI